MRRTQLEQLEENITQQEKNLKIAHGNLDSLTVKAPRAGRLTSFESEIGESKIRGQRLGIIDDINRYKLSGQVSEFYLNKLTIGQRAELKIEENTYQLELTKIYPEVIDNQFKIVLICFLVSFCIC